MSQWRKMESAPNDGVILLRVKAHAPSEEEKVFVAEASFENGEKVWIITTGWVGWTTIHPAWDPIGWQPLPAPDGEVVT